MSLLTTILILIGKIANLTMPIFIFLMVFNAALIETLQSLLFTAKQNWKYFVRMIIVNNCFIPALFWLILSVLPMNPSYKLGILLYFFTAGGPFVLSLIDSSHLKTSLGTSGLIILLMATMLLFPFQLTFIAKGASITLQQIFIVLLKTAIIPLIAGLLMKQFLSFLTSTLFPFLKIAQKWTTNIVIYGMMVAYLPTIFEMVTNGALFALLLGSTFIGISFFIGYLFEIKNADDTAKFTAAFMAGQRNAGIALIVAASNLKDPALLSLVIIISSIGMIELKLFTKWVTRQINSNAS